MKIERRGKFPGVKVHLDGEEAKRIMEDLQPLIGFDVKKLAKNWKSLGQDSSDIQGAVTALEHGTKLAKKIAKEFASYPSLFDERTEEEIKEELETELKAAGDKLALIEQGKKWNSAKSGMKD